MNKAHSIDVNRKDIIQIMRGFAIVAVVAYHALTKFPKNFTLETTEQLMDFFHVNIFFVVSGFLFEKNWKRYAEGGFGKFIKGKLRRIFLPYYLSTILFSLFIAIASRFPAFSSILDNSEYQVKPLLNILTDPLWYHEPLFRSLWFSWCLFWFFIVAWFFRPKWLVHKKMLIGMLGGSFLLSTAAQVTNIYELTHFSYIWRRLIKFYQYFYLGQYVFARFRGELPVSGRTIGCAVFGVCLVALRKYLVPLPDNVIVTQAADQLESLIFAVSIIVLLLVAATKLQGAAKTHLIHLGNSSYTAYLLNSPWIIPIIAAVTKKLSTPAVPAFLIMYICGMFGSILLERLWGIATAKLRARTKTGERRTREKQ